MPCVYMAEVVRDLPQEIKNVIEIKEWDMSKLSGIKRCGELNAKTFPCIYVNNEIIFNSIIPAQEELIKTIMGFMNREH